MPIYDDNTKSIGRTPLVRLNRLDARARATVLAKIEGRNPAYSVKCRIGAAMVWDAEKRGVLGAGQGDRRADQRQHRHRARVRRGGARLPLRAHHARDHEHGAAQGADRVRREAGADAGREGHEGRDRQGGGARRAGSGQVRAPAAVRESGQSRRSTRRPPDRRSGTTPRARSTCSCPASAPAARSPACRATSRRPRARRS